VAAARRQVLGRQGEDAAAAWYEQAGFTIVARNWRASGGELDIVARRDGLVAFCEVKTRSSDRFGTPAEAVTAQKCRRLRRLAGQWLAEQRDRPGAAPVDVRIDVASVTPGVAGRLVVEVIEAVA